MDKINFNQTGGFPLSTNIMNFLQNAYNIFNVFGDFSGDLSIISGCEKTGNSISDGVVFIAGEVLKFKGGIENKHVRIREKVETEEFENGQLKEVLIERYVEFGTATNGYKWKDFKRFENLVSLTQKATESASSIQTLNSDFLKIIKRIVDLENKPDKTVLPASIQEVLQGVIIDKYVSPATLPVPPMTILMTGEISASGSKISHNLKTFTSSRIGRGHYRINHNLGTSRYGIVGSGTDNLTLKVSLKRRFSNYCEVGVSDDSTTNDENFTFQIYKV